MAFTRDPKSMAKTLRAELAALQLDLSHSQSLEIVAKQLGFKDWNTAAAQLVSQAASPLPTLRLPHGWNVSGTQARDYSIGIDDTDPDAAATIQALDKDGPYVGFATLMQSIRAEAFRGKRLKLQAAIRTVDAPGAATIWMRMDDAAGTTVAFDNMEKRITDGVLTGTTDWTMRDVVLDVPDVAESIHYGFYLRGAGQCWAKDFDLTPVGHDVAATTTGKGYFDGPTNLGFAVHP